VGEFQAESLRVAASCAALALWRPGVSGMGAGMSRGRRRGFGLEASRGMLPLLALQVLMEYGRAGASRPPVTAALLAANTLIYLRPGALHEILPSLARVSFNPQLIIEVPNLCLPIQSYQRTEFQYKHQNPQTFSGSELQTCSRLCLLERWNFSTRIKNHTLFLIARCRRVCAYVVGKGNESAANNN